MRKSLMAGIALVFTATMCEAQVPGSIPVATAPVPAVSDCGCSSVVLTCDSCCGMPSCGSCSTPRLWFDTEYLLWWVSKAPLSIPLVTTGNPTDPVPGALGQPGTQVLFGGSGLNYDTFSGLRLTLGGYFGAENTVGFEMSGFLLERRSVGFSASSDAAGNPPLYVPLFFTPTASEGSFTVADPLFPSSGAIAVASELRLWGYEANFLANLRRDSNVSLDVLVGYRYLQLTENIHIDASFNDPDTAIQGQAYDQYATRNCFAGGQIGGRLALNRGLFSLELQAEVALGDNSQQVAINGATFQTGAGLPASTLTPGGILTAPSNISSTAHDVFSVVPELQIKAGFLLLPHLRATVGYDFLYWSGVVRPGDQIDRVVNPTQQFGGTLVGEPRPEPLFQRTGFVAHGVSFGLDLQF